MNTWIVIVEWLARFILLGLLGLSIWSITIILERKRYFKDLLNADSGQSILTLIRNKSTTQLKEFSEKNNSLKQQIIKICFELDSSEKIDRAVVSLLQTEKKNLDLGLSVLGTLGSTTPFVGLLGTILGIIVAFGELSTGQIDSQKVMYALAEALILTAVGLAVAIPAVVAFNIYNRKMLLFLKDCESVKDQFIAYLLGNK